MSGHDIIVIGASADGVEALKTLVQALPAHLFASVGLRRAAYPSVPAECASDASMPRSALALVSVDYTVPLSGIAPLLVRLLAFADRWGL